MTSLQDVAKLSERVARVAAGFDRVPHVLQGSCQFMQNTTAVREVVLNVPSDGDFVGHELRLIAQYRIVTLGSDPPVSEFTFRTLDWTNVYCAAGMFSALLTIRGAHEYQNAPMSAAVAFPARYSTGVNIVNLSGGAQISAYVGGMKFPGGFRARRGTSLTVGITPLYAPSLGTSTEHRVTVAFSGAKLTRLA